MSSPPHPRPLNCGLEMRHPAGLVQAAKGSSATEG